MGLCNFFRHHIQDFAIIAAPLFKLTRQDYEFQSGPLTEAALTAFKTLQNEQSKQPALAFPRHDWKYLLFTNAYLPNKDSPGGLCANLAQLSDLGKIQIISHASRQLKENEKNYTRFLLETAASAWEMDNFNEYLKGSKFTLYRDLTTEATLGTTQLKTLNRLRNTMIDHDFKVQDRQKADLPDFLKKRQVWEEQKDPDQKRAFNKVIHVDLIKADNDSNEISGQTLLSITDDTRTFTQVAVITNSGIDSTASAIWHLWCQPYGPPEKIMLNQGKVQTSKLENWINNFMPLAQRISCRSSKDTFNQDMQQQWLQHRNNVSAEEFAHSLNFLCNLQSPDKAETDYQDHGRLDEAHQSLDDIEDFTESDTDLEEDILDALPPNNLKRKRISLCRHKLQGRAYPKCRNQISKQKQPQQTSNLESDSDHEWLQLIQMEKFIEDQKRKLLKHGAQDLQDEDDTWKKHQVAETDTIKQEDDSLDDEDLSYITYILGSLSKPKLIDPFSPEGALSRAPTQMTPPPKCNQKFNQNSTSYSSKDKNFSYFSNFEQEGQTDLADYFSDEEDDNLDNEDLSSESDIWSQPDSNEFEDSSNQEHAPRYFDTALFGLNTIDETEFEDQGETNNFNGISCLSEETKLAFSEWQLFIPPEHAFQNFAAPSWPSDFSPQASSSQEPTLTQISTITTTTKPTPALMKPISPPPKMALSQLKDWPSFKPATRPFTCTWMKPWPESTKIYSRIKNSRKEFPDHPEPSKQYRPWKRQLRCSPKTNQSQNTRLQNMQQVTDAGSKPQVCIQWQSWTYSNTKSGTSTTRIESWETKWHKFLNKTLTCQTKLPKNTKRRPRSSKRTQLWLWSQERSPPTCSSITTTTEKLIPKQKISPHGENHFSKRRSESKSYSQYKTLNSKSEIKGEIESENRNVKDVKVKNKEKLTTLVTNTKAKMTAKVDEVKAMEKTLTGFRMEIEKQLDKKIGSESPATLPPHSATTFNFSVLICITFTIFYFLYNFISIFNSVVSDPVDHHFQTFTSGDLSNCKMPCLSRQTAAVQAKNSVKAFANPDSIRLFKVPETRPDSRYRNPHRNHLVPNHILPGRVRKSENDIHNDSFIFNYLDFSR